MKNELRKVFAADGLLSQALPDYKPRQSQLEMAEAVADTLTDQSILLCEAGTGTGKTFAYLVPAILSRQTVIISTGTKNLQDQLYYKDIPLITSVLEHRLQRQIQVSLLKGRSNYICLYRLHKALDESWYAEKIQEEIQTINSILPQTRFGDQAEFNRIKEQSPVWPIVTSTTDNCLGSRCPEFEQCYVFRARERAMKHDIVVINHHLLMSDLRLKYDGIGELLPDVQVYIIDEAHQIPDVASEFFSQKLSSGQIRELLKDCLHSLSGTSQPVFMQLREELHQGINELVLVLQRYKSRGSWIQVGQKVETITADINRMLRKLTRLLEPLASGNVELEHCFQRCQQIQQLFQQLTGETPAQSIHWYECRSKNVAIHLTPVSVQKVFYEQLSTQQASWILTSATLTVNDPTLKHEINREHGLHQEFLFFARQLGLETARHIKLDSPFNYAQQAVLFIPQGLPFPDDENYSRQFINAVLPLIEWLEGRTFILFTSFKAMKKARDYLIAKDFNLLVQGDAPKKQLLASFRTTKRAVLLGTSSFWEGVDVKGEALSCVIIDRLPFASPQDPIMQAKIEQLERQGISSFYQLQLPQAAMALKQGIGRLIRNDNDTGVLVIADPRLYLRQYGRYFQQCLPEMPIESDFNHLVRAFSHFGKKIYSNIVK
jgi:ATP-dependent DNA helicase DinG